MLVVICVARVHCTCYSWNNAASGILRGNMEEEVWRRGRQHAVLQCYDMQHAPPTLQICGDSFERNLENSRYFKIYIF